MKRSKISAVLCLMLAALMCLGACGESGGNVNPGGGSGRPAGQKIVIYAGGSSEFAWVAGSEEEAAIEAIEQKYYDDRGVSLDFEVAYLGENMRSKLSSELAGGTQVDIAISHTRGGVGIDDFAINNNLYYDLGEILEDYGSNILDHIEGGALWSVTSRDNEVIGIPSVISPYKFGILVRKDYMEQCGYTDDPAKAETEFTTGQNYILVDNLDDFENMCRAMNTITRNTYAVTGAAWDLEKVLTLGAYGDAGYFTYTYRDEKVWPGYATDEYKDVLDREYKWATTGVTSKEANSILLEAAESNFISGSTGVFVQDPTIQHLIQVARKTKENDPDAEFTVLGPLTASKGGTKKGFMRNSEATFAAVVMHNSQNATRIVRFLNWMYASKDNYELCRYGVKGEHWVDNGDGTYSYPEGKEEYLVRAPYSGIISLVENQSISNLTYAGYTDEEKRWIQIAADENNYIDNDLAEYMFPVNEQLDKLYQNAINALYSSLVVPAWTGAANPLRVENGTVVFDSQITTFRNNAGAYIDFITTAYDQMKLKRTR